MKTIGYIRVSTEEQAREGISLSAQESKIRAYCSIIDTPETDIELIIDAGESGKNLNRPGMKQLIEMIEKKQVSAVVIYKLDRLSRKTIDALNLIEMMDKKEIAIHSISEKIDTKTPVGKFVITILCAFAQMERELIIERVNMALQEKKRQGKKIGRFCPYGYKEGKDDQLEEISDEQEILSIIMGNKKQGRGYSCIADRLNRLGILTRSGGKWYAQTIKSILIHSPKSPS